MSIHPIKTWFHEHIHMPNRSQVALNLNHMIHSTNFWVLLTACALVALFIVLAVLAGTGQPASMPHSIFPYAY